MKSLFPISALAVLSLAACKPTPPPPPPAPPAAPAPAAAADAPAPGQPPVAQRGPGEGPGPGRPGGPGGPGGRGMDFVQRAKDRLERMKTELALTADQEEKIKVAFDEQVAAAKEAFSGENPDREAIMAKMKEGREAVEAKIASILTPEQNARWEALKKQREAEMAERRAKREKKGGDGGGNKPNP